MEYVCLAVSCILITIALLISGIIDLGISPGLFAMGLFFILQLFYNAIKNIGKDNKNSKDD